ncbi:hypothetical protein VP464E531_P0046 [Vibrio phage 464E53-1]|nr:hypothetical protein VP464E531_P0046 [Vibrio phage 464E53-1]
MRVHISVTLKDEDGNSVKEVGGIIEHSEELETSEIVDIAVDNIGEAVKELLLPPTTVH